MVGQSAVSGKGINGFPPVSLSSCTDFFQDIDGEKCEFSAQDVDVIDKVAKLLGLEAEQLKPVLLLRQINVRGNVTEIPLRLQEVRARWIVFRIPHLLFNLC